MSGGNIRIHIRKYGKNGPNEGWNRGKEWGGSDWTKDSDYWYTYHGCKVSPDEEDPKKPSFRVDIKQGTQYQLDQTGSNVIRDVLFCKKDGPKPKAEHLSEKPQTPLTAYPKNTMWYFKAEEPLGDHDYHMWVFAQYDSDGPIIRCDPMVHNKGEG